MVHVKDINTVTGYIRGGCSPLGMKKQFPTVVDESARELDTIIISGGRLGSQILLAPDDLVKACAGSYGDIVFKEDM
jgi:Cys-tRNA(Pro)/Cys-tRNA(Cys) deacylase